MRTTWRLTHSWLWWCTLTFREHLPHCLSSQSSTTQCLLWITFVPKDYPISGPKIVSIHRHCSEEGSAETISSIVRNSSYQSCCWSPSTPTVPKVEVRTPLGVQRYVRAYFYQPFFSLLITNSNSFSTLGPDLIEPTSSARCQLTITGMDWVRFPGLRWSFHGNIFKNNNLVTITPCVKLKMSVLWSPSGQGFDYRSVQVTDIIQIFLSCF